MKLSFRTCLIACVVIAAVAAGSTDAFAQKVLIVAADDPAFVADVRSKLESTHLVTAVDVFDASAATPTLDQLTPYDAGTHLVELVVPGRGRSRRRAR